MTVRSRASIDRYLEPIARAWLTSGAESLALTIGDEEIGLWPRHAPDSPSEIVAPVRSGRTEIGKLRVRGIHGHPAAERLVADAGAVSGLLDLESQLARMTAELASCQDQLVAVFELARAARQRIGIDDVLKTVVEEAGELTQSTFAFAVLPIDGVERLVQSDANERPAMQPAMLELAAWVRCANRSVVVNAGELPPTGLNYTASDACAIAVPVRVDGQPTAALGAFRPADHHFTAGSRALLEAIADHTGTLIENAFALQEALKRQRLQRDLELASEVQRTLVARTIPVTAGLDIAARYRPAAEIGGDLYGLFTRPDGQLVTTVADVTGKGVPAALVMSMVRVAMTGAANTSNDPAEALNRVNNDLYADLTELSKFVTAFMAYYDPVSRLLQVANCGHSPVVSCRHGKVPMLLEADGPPIGVLEGNVTDRQQLVFGIDDVLIVATDGVSEAINAAGELFGYDRLLAFTGDMRGQPAAIIADSLIAEVETFAGGTPQADDQAVVVLKGVAA